MSKPWVASYPPNVPAELASFPYRSLDELLAQAFAQHGRAVAFRFLGAAMSFAELDAASRDFAAYLQSLGVRPGDRVALMMPNVPQYPIAVAGVIRAGCVVVNVNPLYTPRELEHQLNDADVAAIVILENMAATLSACLAKTPVRHVVLAAIGDCLPRPKRWLVDFVVRRVRKLVPPFELPTAVCWRRALRHGRGAPLVPSAAGLDDVAVLQYTGGTTGIAKGAMLTHRNIVANVLQSEAWYRPALDRVPNGMQPTTICALPLYHIFGFTVNMMLSMRTGGCNILILNPRDLPALLKEMRRQPFHSFPAVNTLFAAVARHPEAAKLDWSQLQLAVGGGMAVQAVTAERWKALTGVPICEGYGLSETSPSACCNPVAAAGRPGTIGLPLPSTDLRVLTEDDGEAPPGTPGEIAIRGPQVFAGYWRRPDETAQVLTADGFFRTGDIGTMDEGGYFRIIDRKKDMINVSGFNVYPNEIEDVVLRLAGLAEAAAIGVPDGVSGEAVKLFLVKSDPAVTEDAVRAHCRAYLTGYKRPKHIEFRQDLPKTNVGKVLRRALREA